jgi:hypothetical protein
VSIGVDSVLEVSVGLAVGIDGMDIRSQPEAARIIISKKKKSIRDRMAD